MRKEKPPYMYMTRRGRFFNLNNEAVIPTLRGIAAWFRRYKSDVGFWAALRIAFALSLKSLTHRAHPSSPTGSR